MAGTGVDDAQGMTAGGEVKIHGVNHRGIFLEEVDGHQVAHGGSHLIHQTAGLAEEHVLGVLTNLGNLRLGYPGIKEQMVDDGANQHLEGSRGAEAGAGQHRGGAVGIEALHLAAQLMEPGSNAPNQSGGGVDFLCHRLQLVELYHTHGVALGENPDFLRAVAPYCRQCVQIDGGCQHPSPLVVGVVAANFRAAGGGEIALRCAAKGFGKACIQLSLLGLSQM